MKNLLLTISLNGLSRKEQTRKRIICAEKVYQTLTGYGDLLCCCLPKTWRKTQSLWQVSKSPGHISASEGLCMSVPIPGGSCTPSETPVCVCCWGNGKGLSHLGVTANSQLGSTGATGSDCLCDRVCVTRTVWQGLHDNVCVLGTVCDRDCVTGVPAGVETCPTQAPASNNSLTLFIVKLNWQKLVQYIFTGICLSLTHSLIRERRIYKPVWML